MLSPDVLMEMLLSIFAMLVIAVLLYMIGFAGYCAQRMLCCWVASWPLWRLPLHKIVGLCVLAVAAGLFGRKATNPNDAPPPLMTQGQGGGLTVEGLDEGDGIVRTNDFFISHVSSTENGWLLGVSWRAGMVPEDDTVDLFSCSDLVSNDWRWVKGMAVVSGMTNCLFMIGSDELVPTNAPRQFFKVNVRGSVASGMEDFDGDGLPNVYELEHDRNPYVDDYALVGKLTVGPTGTYTTLQAVLANTIPYAVIELLPEMGRVEYSTSISMPAHPVMIVGPPDGYARIRYSGYIGAFILDAGQDGRTLFRNIYLELTGHSSPIAGFWCGASTAPLTNTGTATFENIYIRMMNSSPTYYGWYFQRANFRETRIDHCVVNAEGARHATGVRCVDADHLEICGCSFLNFPAEPQHAFAAILLGATGIGGMSNVCTEVSRSLFDGSFSNQYAIAYFDPATDDAIAFRDCILPTPLCDYIPTVTDALLITNASLTKAGFPLPGSAAIERGIGALDLPTPDSPQDSDGDGLTDYQEIFIYGTSPICEDTDGDKFNDAVEINMNSDPNDVSNFCFNVSFCVTNDWPHEGALFGVFPGSEPHAMCLASSPLTNRINMISFDHVMVEHGEVPTIRIWADWNANGLWETTESNRTLQVEIKGDTVQGSALVSQKVADVDNDGMSDTWEILHDLSPTDSADDRIDSDGDGLINLHEYWAGCNPRTPDGSNTWFSIFSRSVDDRIANVDPMTSVNRFNDFFNNASNGVFRLNTNFWACGLDFSCISVWNDGAEPGSMSATAITKRHVVLSEHWNSNRYFFCDTNGVCVERTVDYKAQVYGDLVIGRLNADLPNTFTPAKVASPNFLLHLHTGRYLPTVCLNQEKCATVLELQAVDVISTRSSDLNQFIHSGMICETNYVSQQRIQIRASSNDGNSGSPTFLISNDGLILLFAKHLGLHVKNWAVSYGPMVSFWLNEIQEKINEWEGDASALYQLDVYDLQL